MEKNIGIDPEDNKSEGNSSSASSSLKDGKLTVTGSKDVVKEALRRYYLYKILRLVLIVAVIVGLLATAYIEGKFPEMAEIILQTLLQI